MKKLLIVLIALLPGLAVAAGSNVPLQPANVDLNDQESLQRGFVLFQENCAGCHSTQYQRYDRVANDIGIPIDEMREKYMFTDAKVGDLMENAIPTKDAANWFGAAPPDLTLVARVRGEDWLYSYLNGFYADPTRPFGVNNTVFPLVGMPHVLQTIQGVPVMQDDGTIVATGGTMNAEEYQQATRDITAYLKYAGDPSQMERKQLGMWVLGFLFIFFVVAYLLKKEYWKDVH
ncbi:cytochrome c1 [Shewanella sp. NIFS-20-20]|uniref:cytochrome c1 n=1 Tax=Shewanella sp. NIFS-20-20 TaxID=2853806 RepID=UPI001C48BD00|nr:cytochrome c1 [Shewanella sp. NIFS-20-20]MBV7316755.1 cytochrome c1 [Shewanella sp. NIFS-20-20]